MISGNDGEPGMGNRQAAAGQAAEQQADFAGYRTNGRQRGAVRHATEGLIREISGEYYGAEK